MKVINLDRDNRNKTRNVERCLLAILVCLGLSVGACSSKKTTNASDASDSPASDTEPMDTHSTDRDTGSNGDEVDSGSDTGSTKNRDSGADDGGASSEDGTSARDGSNGDTLTRDSGSEDDATNGDTVTKDSYDGTRDDTRSGGEDVVNGDTQLSRDGSLGDVSSPNDARSADAGANCRQINLRRKCKQASNCRIWAPQCGGKRLFERCIPRSLQPARVRCKSVPPKKCHTFSTRQKCHQAGQSCRWVTKGCSPSSGDVAITGCLPDKKCQSPGDCPSNHDCRTVHYNPCAQYGLQGITCNACGANTNLCVPQNP